MKISILSRLALVLLAGIALAAPVTAQQVLVNPMVSGHLRSGPDQTGGAAPALSTCGTGPAIQAGSNDQAGRLVTGSGATTCTITFARTYGSAPACVVSAEVATQPTYTVSATAITFATSIASTAYHYNCRGIGSGS